MKISDDTSRTWYSGLPVSQKTVPAAGEKPLLALLSLAAPVVAVVLAMVLPGSLTGALALGLALSGVVLSIFVLVRGDAGRGPAIAGLVVGILVLLPLSLLVYVTSTGIFRF